MHSPAVSGLAAFVWRWMPSSCALLALAGCAEAQAQRPRAASAPPAAAVAAARGTPSSATARAASIDAIPEDASEATPPEPPRAAPRPDEHWFFEALSLDGRRALLRALDPRARATFHVRVVDVESGRTIEETSLPELAKVPASTIGGKQAELAELEWMLASPAFGRDIVRGSHIAGSFPFGACGRLAANASGSTIAFDAGDWLYVADETGRVRRRLVEEAAYDPRFTPDGKHLVFRRATGSVDGVFAKYELFAAPSDLSAPPRPLPGTAGMRDRFVALPSDKEAIGVALQPRARGGAPATCVVSLSLRPPFSAKRLGCLDGTEPLVESIISPKGKYAALSTKRIERSDGERREVSWRVRVLSLATGKVVRDEPEPAGLTVRAISDAGLLVQSGALGAIVTDVVGKRSRAIDPPIDLGHRGFFRSDTELVYLADDRVRLLDLAELVAAPGPTSAR